MMNNSKSLINELSMRIKVDKLWYHYYDSGDSEGNINIQQFEQVTRSLIQNISEMDLETLERELFKFQQIPLSELGLKLKISVLEQQKSIQIHTSIRENNKLGIKNADLSQSNSNNTRLQQQQSIQNQQVINEEDADLQSPIKVEQQSQPKSAARQAVILPREATQVKEEPELTLDEQISAFFKQIDDNNNQWLDPKELNQALLQLGINPTPQDLIQYFQIFDKNNDEKISESEFQQIIKDQIMKQLLGNDDMSSLIRQEFKMLSDANSQELDMAQIKQVFNKIGLQLENSDLHEIFEEIDLDSSGFVELVELINFMSKPYSQQSEKAQKVLIKIANHKKISLQEMRDFFGSIPENFTYSQLYGLNKKGNNLPSQALKPILDQSGLTYQDLNLIPAQKYNLQASLFEMQEFSPEILMEIKLLSAEAVPSPDPLKCKPDLFVLREVAVCVFDHISNKYLGNTIYIPCLCDSTSPDKWMFPIDYPIIFIWKQTKERQLSLIFEFIAYMESLKTLTALSISYGALPLENIKGAGKLLVTLNGGSPYNNISIDPATMRQQTGWFKKALTTPILTLQLTQVVEKKSTVLQQMVSVLPQNCIIPKKWVSLLNCFREYIAYRTINQGQFNHKLPDYKIRSILDVLNIQEAPDTIADWWNKNVKIVKYADKIKFIEILAQRLFLMFQRTDFQFKNYSLVQRLNHLKNQQQKRRVCVKELLQDVGMEIGIPFGGRRSDAYYDMEPMILNELMDNEDDTSDIIELKKRKKQNIIK